MFLTKMANIIIFVLVMFITVIAHIFESKKANLYCIEAT